MRNASKKPGTQLLTTGTIGFKAAIGGREAVKRAIRAIRQCAVVEGLVAAFNTVDRV